jgi:hypothetical protein
MRLAIFGNHDNAIIGHVRQFNQSPEVFKRRHFKRLDETSVLPALGFCWQRELFGLVRGDKMDPNHHPRKIQVSSM